MMIREMRIDDLKQVTHLFVKVFNKAPWHDQWTIETAFKRLTDMFHTPGFKGMVYETESSIIGMILGRKEQYFDGIHFQILEFCIDTEIQSQGYGKKLLSSFIGQLEKEDVTEVFLLTMPGAMTEGFYERNGFISNEKMILMSKQLGKV